MELSPLRIVALPPTAPLRLTPKTPRSPTSPQLKSVSRSVSAMDLNMPQPFISLPPIPTSPSIPPRAPTPPISHRHKSQPKSVQESPCGSSEEAGEDPIVVRPRPRGAGSKSLSLRLGGFVLSSKKGKSKNTTPEGAPLQINAYCCLFLSTSLVH
jgi:hypothetical protein